MSTTSAVENVPPDNPSMTASTKSGKTVVDAWFKTYYLGQVDGIGDVPLRVRDYINYIRSATPETSYFTNEMIDWALEVVRTRCRINETSDTYIAPILLGQILFSLGNDLQKANIPSHSAAEIVINPEDPSVAPTQPAVKTPQEEHPGFYNAMQNKRFIFLPVNNGYNYKSQLDQYNKEQKAELKRNKLLHKPNATQNETGDQGPKNGSTATLRTSGTDKQPVEDSAIKTSSPKGTATHKNTMAGTGKHWSFIVVDTNKGTARYIDSLVRASGSGKKHKITNIDWNAPVAGRVLTGFDVLMKRQRGGFDARTLKWVPHQVNNNRTRNDTGACGPYVYALMDYINRNRNSTLLSRNSLEGFFTRTNKRNVCDNLVRFDSNEARERIQRQLEEIRLAKEANADENALHPANLDPTTLLSVLDPNTLRQVANGPFLKQLLDIHEPPKHDSGEWVNDPKVAEKFEAFWAKQAKGKQPSDTDADDDEDMFRTKLWSEHFAHLDHEDAMRAIDNFLNSRVSDPKDSVTNEEWQKRQDFAIMMSLISDKLPNDQFRQAIWNVREDFRREYAKHIASTRSLPKRQLKRNRLQSPPGITDLPLDFADVKEVPSFTLELWKSANMELLNSIFVDAGKPKEDLSYRAALQACSGQRFMDESQKRIQEIWSEDRYAVPQNMGWTWKAIQSLLKKTYEDASWLPVLPDSSNDYDDDANDDDGAGDEDEAERDDTTGYSPDVQDAADKLNPLSRGWEVQYPKGFDKDNIVFFAWIPDDDLLETWIDPAEDLFTPAPGITFHNDTLRLLVHRFYGGTFKKLSHDALLKLNHDTNAFGSADIALWSKERIVTELDATYQRLALPPTFAALSDAEVDHWVERLHPRAYDLVKGPVREGMPRATLYQRARGLLHRMFVGELDEMTAEQIKTWREHDRNVTGEYKNDNQGAMVIMKILYEGEGLENVPWLLNSPLHWPARKHRDKRGSKRKRDDDFGFDDDDDDEDDEDDGNNNSKRAKTGDAPQPDRDIGPTDTNTPVANRGPHGAVPNRRPGPLDWLNMPDSELLQHITSAERNDPRMGAQANNYSYRALLMVKRDHGSFKDDSQKGNEMLWMRDTNVFSHGLEAPGRNFDLTVQRDRDVSVKVKGQNVLPRMALKYEPDVMPVNDSAPKEKTLKVDKPKAKENTPAPKEKTLKVDKPKAKENTPAMNPTTTATPVTETGGNGTGGTQAADAEGLYTQTPDFLAASKEYILPWIELHPDADLRKKKTGLWVWKRVLQRHFGGYDSLSDDTLRTAWTHDTTFFREMKKSDPKFDRQRVLDELKKPVVKTADKKKETKQHYEERDLLGDKRYYSQKYIDWYNATHGVKTPATPPAKEATPDSAARRSIRSQSKASPSPQVVATPNKAAKPSAKKASTPPKNKTPPPPKNKTPSPTTQDAPAPPAQDAPAPPAQGTQPTANEDEDEGDWEYMDESG